MSETEDMAEPDPQGGRLDGVRQAARTLSMAASARPLLVIVITLVTLVAALLPAAALYVSKLVIDGVVTAIDTGAQADRDMALIWVGVESGLLALLLAARRGLVFFKGQLHAELGFIVSQRILDKADSFSLFQIEDPAIQEKLVMARQFSASRPYSLINRVFDLAQHGLTLVFLLALLVTSAPWLILLVVAGGLPVFIGNLRFSGDAYRFYTGRTPQMRERNYLEGLLTQEGAARERLHFAQGAELKHRFRGLFDTLHGDDTALKGRQALFGTLLGLTGSAVFLGGKIWIVAVTIGGAFTLGQMTMLVGLLKQGQAAVNNVLSAFSGSYEDVLYVTNLYDLLDTPPDRSPGTAISGPDPQDGLRFDHVSYRYPGQKRPALNAVSFQLKPGMRMGIVGANGSGKTTLVKLATGLYTPDSGRVTLDGLDLVEWDAAALRQRLGVLFQPHVNYKLSVRDNILAGMGWRDVPDDQVERAIDAGLARSVVEDLPGGLDARLSKRFPDGQELSGGQWQRLAMARALLNEDADILILDEPTAALDPAAEAAFLNEERPGQSLILISHRLSNLRNADLILVLDKGQTVATGDHATLMAEGGLYAELFALQAEAYR
ncbi:ABC transporter ATP-binding protein [Maricaulis parjimensis]|uniref:ABC transporter ATP-binding protein n=1 Tax=Maricaulis parjimensis TaxID=144023 RepID=UPI001939A2A7|nr:ABC transporter ATP-binding protein [Maricaulis parjimensis]